MTSDALEREWQLLASADPAARAALAAPNPDGAYEAICMPQNVFLDDPEMPHTGGLYCAWAELEDLFEIGRTSPDEFHALVRVAAESGLARPATRSSEWIDRWVADTRDAVAARFDRDGTILDGKPF